MTDDLGRATKMTMTTAWPCPKCLAEPGLPCRTAEQKVQLATAHVERLIPEVVHLRAQRDELQRSLNREVNRRRKLEAETAGAVEKEYGTFLRMSPTLLDGCVGNAGVGDTTIPTDFFLMYQMSVTILTLSVFFISRCADFSDLYPKAQRRQDGADVF